MTESRQAPGPGWRARQAFISALFGWGTAVGISAVYFLAGVSRLLAQQVHVPFWSADEPWVLVFWLIVTGVFTFLVVLMFITPYVIARSSESILRRPWRMYLETGAIGLICIGTFNLRNHPPAYTVKQYFPMQVPYMVFALVVSLASSHFYLRRLSKVTRAGSKAPKVGTAK